MRKKYILLFFTVYLNISSCSSANFNPVSTRNAPRIQNDINSNRLKVKQISSTDCSVASVSGVLSYWGEEVSQEEIKEFIGKPAVDGYTVRQLQDFLESIGYIGFILKGDYELLVKHTTLSRPVIIILKTGLVLNHSVIVYKAEKKGSEYLLTIMDPNSGEFFLSSSLELEKQWASLGYPFFLIGKID